MLDSKPDPLAQYYAMKQARAAALKLVVNNQHPCPCDLDGMVIPHPFRERELVRFDTLMAQVEATSQLPESGPGLPWESRYLALLDLACSHMQEDDARLFRFAVGLEPGNAISALRKAHGLEVIFIMPETYVA